MVFAPARRARVQCGHAECLEVRAPAARDDIAAEAGRMAAFSATGAAAVLYENQRSILDDYAHALTPSRGGAG